ncbi:unnamed protein product, partial [Iphiclides podalirius]
MERSGRRGRGPKKPMALDRLGSRAFYMLPLELGGDVGSGIGTEFRNDQLSIVAGVREGGDGGAQYRRRHRCRRARASRGAASRCTGTCRAPVAGRLLGPRTHRPRRGPHSLRTARASPHHPPTPAPRTSLETGCVQIDSFASLREQMQRGVCGGQGGGCFNAPPPPLLPSPSHTPDQATATAATVVAHPISQK